MNKMNMIQLEQYEHGMNAMILACNMITLPCTNLLCSGYLITIAYITYHHTIISGSNQAWYYNVVVIINDHKELDLNP